MPKPIYCKIPVEHLDQVGAIVGFDWRNIKDIERETDCSIRGWNSNCGFGRRDVTHFWVAGEYAGNAFNAVVRLKDHIASMMNKVFAEMTNAQQKALVGNVMNDVVGAGK